MAFGDVFQRDLHVSAAARYAGRDGPGFGNQRVDQPVDVLGIVAYVFVSDAFRSARIDRNHRTVFQRRHLGRNPAPQDVDDADHRQHDREGEHPAAQERRQRAAVKTVHADEERFGLAVEPPRPVAVLQQLGRQHRCESQRRECRNDHRAGHYEAEFPEQPAGHALHEYDREKDGHQRDGRRDDGEKDLLSSFDTGLLRTHAAFDADVDIFGHHNRVVDDQSDGQHHGQHRQHVDRESGQVHHEERSDQRDGDYYARHQRHAPVAQEQENDDDHQEEGFVYGAFDFVDRGADEFRVVESVAGFHVFGQILFHPFHSFVDRVGDFDVVGSGLRDHDDADHRHPVHLHVAAGVLRAELRPSDVAESDDSVVLFFDY